MAPVNARFLALAAASVAVVVGLAGCGSSASTPLVAGAGSRGAATIRVVAAENEYGDVASQIGGAYVRVTSIESNPNTDPHSYEVSPSVAHDVSTAQLVIQNGLGYDDFMSRVEAAAPSSSRRVIDVQSLLRLPDSTPNPHLWYSPATMPEVAAAMAADLGDLQPSHTAYFQANEARFVASLEPWIATISRFKAADDGVAVATTEPVADYVLQAIGADNLTPFPFQADVMNGVDPSPQGVAFEAGLFSGHKVKVFVYNQQVADTLTQGFIADAQRAGIPVVGVYETMPVPGYDYQSWMLAEVQALQRAVADGVSTVRL